MLPAMAATHQGAWLDHRPLLHSDSVQQPAQSVTAGKQNLPGGMLSLSELKNVIWTSNLHSEA